MLQGRSVTYTPFVSRTVHGLADVRAATKERAWYDYVQRAQASPLHRRGSADGAGRMSQLPSNGAA